MRKSGMSTLHSLNSGERIRVSKTRSTVGSVEDIGRARDSAYIVAPPMMNPRCRFFTIDGSRTDNADLRLSLRITRPSSVFLIYNEFDKLLSKQGITNRLYVAFLLITIFVRFGRGLNFVGMLSQVFLPMMTAFWLPSGAQVVT